MPVPQVVGLTSNQAGVELGRAGFEVTFVDEASSAPAGTVLRTDPAEGTELPKGETVTVFTSNGRVGVPNVVGQLRADAIAILDGAGFQVAEAARDVSDRTQQGVVVAQNPPAAAEAATGSSVTIAVGRFVAPSTTTTSSSTTSTTSTTVAAAPGEGAGD